MEDMELLRRYADFGDKDAISRLVDKYHKLVYSTCLRKLGRTADAEDTTQQVFLAMMQSCGKIKSSLKQWLYRCSNNIAVSMIRSSSSRARREEARGWQVSGVCNDGQAEQNEATTILKECLNKLDTTDQQLLIQSQVHNVTQQSIASSMGVTQQAVAKRLGKVLLQLRYELSSRGVIFTLIAAVILLLKRAVTAAVPQRLRDALASAPSSSFVTGGAATAGTAGVLKTGAAAALVLAAVATYECVEQRRYDPPASGAKTVCLVSAESPPAISRTVASGLTIRKAPSAAAIPPAEGLVGRTVKVRQAKYTPAPSGLDVLNSPASARRHDRDNGLAAQHRPSLVMQDFSSRNSTHLATSAFLGKFHSSRPGQFEGIATSAEAEQGESSEKPLPKVSAEKIRAFASEIIAVKSLPSGAISPKGRPTGRRVAFRRARPTAMTAHPTLNSKATSLSKETTVSAGTTLTAAGTLDGRLINQGTVMAKDDDAPLYITGLASGRGSYTGDVVFTGEFSPGNSPAAVYLDNATLDPTSTLTMELAGTTPGSEYDQLIIGDHLTLGGDLNVELIYGFMPQMGNSFTLFDGDFSGQFADMMLPTLGDGLSWNTNDFYTSGSLAVMTSGSLAVVPEPATLALLGLGGLCLLLKRKRKP